MFKIIIVKEDKTGQKEVNINEATRETLKQTAKTTAKATAKTLEILGEGLLKLNKKVLKKIKEE
jgi:ribosomal 50S subunit-associated protein YjgA (DUF615 family)